MTPAGLDLNLTQIVDGAEKSPVTKKEKTRKEKTRKED